MELRLSNSYCSCVLWLCSFALCAIIGTHPVASIEVYTQGEMFVENGTTGVLECNFKSNQVISSQASVSWSFVPEGPSESTGETIFYYAGGKEFPGTNQFKDRMVGFSDTARFSRKGRFVWASGTTTPFIPQRHSPNLCPILRIKNVCGDKT